MVIVFLNIPCTFICKFRLGSWKPTVTVVTSCLLSGKYCKLIKSFLQKKWWEPQRIGCVPTTLGAWEETIDFILKEGSQSESPGDLLFLKISAFIKTCCCFPLRHLDFKPLVACFQRLTSLVPVQRWNSLSGIHSLTSKSLVWKPSTLPVVSILGE